jgi:hypothetical protein
MWEPQPPEPSGPVRACNGIALPLPLPFTLGYLHFTDSDKETDKSDENHNKLWKIMDIF